MPLVAGDALNAEPWQVGELLCEPGSGGRIGESGSPHARVDLNQHPERGASLGRSTREITCVLQVVNGDEDAALASKVDQSRDLRRASHGIDDEKIVEPRFGEDDRFPDSGRRESPRAGLGLQARKVGTFVSLDVWPQ